MTNPNPAAPLPDDWIDKRLSDPLWNEAWHFGYEAAKRDAARAPEGMDEIVAAIRSVLSVTPDTAEGAGMHRMGEYVIDKIATLDAARATSTPAGLREALHRANVGCTWDEQIPKQRMCDPSWHDEQADRLRAALQGADR